MNKKFSFIINLLMISLIVVLVAVMMNYYADTPYDIPTHETVKIDNVLSGDIASDNKPIINIQKNDEEPGTETNTSGDISLVKGENVDEQSGDTNIPPQKEINIPEQNNETVIISSESETSNKEKREILTELDKTLMDLLDVVDKVQTVDETRLITDDSGVQE